MAGEPGDFRCICDFSGFQCWASETAFTWDHRRVIRRFLGAESQRHPQDFVRGVPDDQSVRNGRPESADVFLAYNSVTPSSL